MTDKSFFDNEISEKEEIPFKMLRYQNTEHGVFDLTRNLYMDSRECATQLQKYLEENHELANEIKELKLANKRLEIDALNATLALREMELKVIKDD